MLVDLPTIPRRKIQRGDEPNDWKPFDDVDAGTKEIRIKLADGAFGVMYKKAFKFTIDALGDMPARTGMHVQLSVL